MVFSAAAAPRSLATINITPLVDVMLVLLVIFMIATPLLSKAIPLTLPGQPPPQLRPDTPRDPIDLRIDAAGDLRWNGEPIAVSALPMRMREAVQQDPQRPAVLQIDASGDADYAVVVKVLDAANAAALERIGFVRH